MQLNWATKCAEEYADNPTPGRAHNAAQQLAPVLAEIEVLKNIIYDLTTNRYRVSGAGLRALESATEHDETEEE